MLRTPDRETRFSAMVTDLTRDVPDDWRVSGVYTYWCSRFACYSMGGTEADLTGCALVAIEMSNVERRAFLRRIVARIRNQEYDRIEDDVMGVIRDRETSTALDKSTTGE